MSTHLALYNLARVAQAQDDEVQTAQRFAQGLSLAGEIGDRANAAYCLEGLAEVAMARGEATRAARLFGAAAALLQASGALAYAYVPDRSLYERTVAAARAQLGEAVFGAAWAAGWALPLDQAIAEALEQAAAGQA